MILTVLKGQIISALGNARGIKGTIFCFFTLKGQFNTISDVAIIIKIVCAPHFSPKRF